MNHELFNNNDNLLSCNENNPTESEVFLVDTPHFPSSQKPFVFSRRELDNRGNNF
jgi:hypothetical protein